MTLADYQRGFTRACTERSPDDALFASLGSRPERWRRYRAMVRGRFAEILGDALPRTRRALGDPLFDEVLAGFLEGGMPRTRYVREVSLEFVEYLVGEGSAVFARAPFWLEDIARYEAARMECLIAPDAPDEPVRDFEMERPPLMAPWCRLLVTGHSVQLDPPRVVRSALLVYREGPTGGAQVLTLNPVAESLVRRFIAGDRSVSEAVSAVLAERKEHATQAFAEALAELLGDLMDRGILLGSRGDGDSR